MMQSKDMFFHWNLYWNTFFFKSLLRKVEIWQLFPFCVNAFQQIKCKSSRGKNSHFAGSSIFFVFLLWFHQYLHWISIFVDFIVLMIHKVKFLLRCNICINIKIDMIIVHELTFFFKLFIHKWRPMNILEWTVNENIFCAEKDYRCSKEKIYETTSGLICIKFYFSFSFFYFGKHFFLEFLIH